MTEPRSAATRSTATACSPPTRTSATRSRRRRCRCTLPSCSRPTCRLADSEPIMVHELAHQWFGDSVAPRSWSDVWLNEGHADLVRVAVRGRVLPRREPGYDFVPRVQRGLLARGPVAQAVRAGGAPDARTSCSTCSARTSTTAALTVLYALRQVIGERAFERARAPLGPAERGPVGGHRRFHRARLEGRRPRPRPVPARLAVRHEDAGDAGTPGLDVLLSRCGDRRQRAHGASARCGRASLRPHAWSCVDTV